MSGFSGVADAAAWTAFTPTITASSGSITTKSGVGWYKQIGKTIHCRVALTITTNGTGAGNIIFTLPVAPKLDTRFFNLGLNNTNGTTLLCYTDNSTGNGLLFILSSGAYPGADGAVLHSSLTYEAA